MARAPLLAAADSTDASQTDFFAGLPQSFGRTLREQRARRKIGLRHLARVSGLSASYLSRIERDLVPPPSPKRIRRARSGVGRRRRGPARGGRRHPRPCSDGPSREAGADGASPRRHGADDRRGGHGRVRRDSPAVGSPSAAPEPPEPNRVSGGDDRAPHQHPEEACRDRRRKCPHEARKLAKGPAAMYAPWLRLGVTTVIRGHPPSAPAILAVTSVFCISKRRL